MPSRVKLWVWKILLIKFKNPSGFSLSPLVFPFQLYRSEVVKGCESQPGPLPTGNLPWWERRLGLTIGSTCSSYWPEWVGVRTVLGIGAHHGEGQWALGWKVQIKLDIIQDQTQGSRLGWGKGTGGRGGSGRTWIGRDALNQRIEANLKDLQLESLILAR